MNKLIVLFIYLFLTVVSPAFVIADTKGAKPPLVLMLLWRGITDAERGFQEYFDVNDIPVRYEIWDANKDLSQLQSMIDKIPQLAPDLIYTFGTTVSLQLAGTYDGQVADRSNGIPVVFNIVADPWGARLIASEPSAVKIEPSAVKIEPSAIKINPSADTHNRHITGVSHSVSAAAQIAAIQQLGDFTRIAALLNPAEKNSRLAINALKASAEEQGIQVETLELDEGMMGKKADSLSKKLDRLKELGTKLIYLPSDSLVISHASKLIDTIHQRGLLTFSATEAPIRKGGALIGIVSRYRNVGQLAGYKAKLILQDKKLTTTIPVETLSKFSFIVNMQAAHQLDFYPPVTMLQFAEVIK